MTNDFDEHYWDRHWQQARARRTTEPNPYLVHEIGGLPPGTALDAGCGEGGEAIWLASRGWQVSAADISADALDRATALAAARTADDGLARDLQWLRVDLTVWDPGTQFDLVTTHYAHPPRRRSPSPTSPRVWTPAGGRSSLQRNTPGR